MNKLSIATSAASIALLLATAAPALAREGADDASIEASVNVQTSTSGPNRGEKGNILEKLKMNLDGNARIKAEREKQERMKHASNTEDRMDKAIEHSGNAIEQRIKSLEQLKARLSGMKLLPAETLATISAALDAQIADLVALKAKIGTEVSGDELKADIKSITQGNRVYLLTEPKARIAAAASRINAVVTQMTTLGGKLQERITAASTAGVDVSAATAALADFNIQLGEAKANADAAVSLTANLQVDNGDKTVKEANAAALKSAKAKLEAAQKDLAEARKDIGTIVGTIKGKGEVKAETH